MDTVSSFYCQSPKTGSISGVSRNLQGKGNLYSFGKLDNYAELFSRDNEPLFGKVKN